ncbi:MAG: outer membrane protein OmpA-like peptidoglycan-associated protein, partial [Cyclobacteriaceae bacterium]
SYELKKESYSELETVFEFLKANRNITIEIQGYSDSKGEKSYNLDLSKNRAEAVYNYLIGRKVPRGMLSFKGYGASNFIISNDTAENQAKNRRIEFKVGKIAK